MGFEEVALQERVAWQVALPREPVWGYGWMRPAFMAMGALGWLAVSCPAA